LWQVRLPAHAAQEWQAYQRVRATWTQSRGTDPTPEDLATLLGWPLSRIAFWQHWEATSARPLSLDAPQGDDADFTLGDLVEAPELSVWQHLDDMARQQAVDMLLDYLTPREADVLRLRFGMAGSPMTLQEIGELFHVTRERIRQIEAKALKTLRTETQKHPEWDLRALMG